jgi:hypothetical protein
MINFPRFLQQQGKHRDMYDSRGYTQHQSGVRVVSDQVSQEEGGWQRTALRWCRCRMRRQRVPKMLLLTPLFIIFIVYIQLVRLTWHNSPPLGIVDDEITL